MNLTQPKYQLYEANSSLHHLLIREDSNLMRKINRILNYPYPKTYTFQDTDEPVFKVSEAKLSRILKALNVKLTTSL